jgi:CBS domain-containing protein
MKKARDIMTAEVICVTPETTVTELAHLLRSKDINGVPVLDSSGKLLGIVTENDLIFQKKKVHIPTMINILDSVFYLENPDKMEKEMLKIAGTTVEAIYSKPALTVEENASVEEIATLMTEKNIHTIPVVRQGTLVGVVGKKDIIRTLIP